MRKTLAVLTSGIAALGLVAGVASGAGKNHRHSHRTTSAASAPTTSRLDDGKNLLSQARISEQDAITAAQKVASGPLDEIDLEHYAGRLVFTVDVGSHDVKVDAANGRVLASQQDD